PQLPELPPPPAAGNDRERLRGAAAAALAELAAAAQIPTVERAIDGLQRCLDALASLPEGALGEAEAFAEIKIPRGARALKTDAVQEAVHALEAWVGACRAPEEHLNYTLLRELVGRFSARYAAAKTRRSGLDFDDLELRVRDLLERNGGLRESYRARFEHVMVDEFQDTNRLQVDVLELVARPDNLFTVGDEFQSIYLFRHADVELFRGRGEAAAGAGHERRLTANFRSDPEVLAVLNEAYAGELEGFEPLVAARPPAGSDPAVELMITDSDAEHWAAHFPAGEEDPFALARREVPIWRAAEARLVAARVRDLIDVGECEPAEVALLLRATTDTAVFEQALEELGVPTYVSGGRGYWTQQQVADLRTYLAALANPRDEQALMALLGSPLVGVSLDSLALIGRHRRAHRDHNAWSLLEDCFGARAEGDGELAATLGGDAARVGEFVRRFAAERRAAPRVSLESLIDRAIASTGYDQHVLSLHSGRRRMANLRKLMRLARTFEADGGRDLRGFIALLDEQAGIAAREGQAPLEAEDLQAVRIMTVHAAKGLEFPVVVLADLGRHARGDNEALVVTDDGKVGLQLASMSGAASAAMELPGIRADQRAQQDEEERRVFYVAMTRAQRRLVVSGAAKVETWPEHKPLGPPIDWVHRALAPGFADAVTDGGVGELRRGDASVRCVLNTPATVDSVLAPDRRRPVPERATSPEEQMPLPPEFTAVERSEPLPVSRLSYSGLERHRACGYRFYLERVLGLPATEEDPLAVEPEQIAEQDEPGRDELPARLRGSVVHELLERLDLQRPAAPPAAVVAGLIRDHGSEPLADDVEAIRGLVDAFGRSELCERLAAARSVRREQPFVYTLDAGGGRLLMNGVVDVHAQVDGGVLIVDYKSDVLGDVDPTELCERRYSGQRLVYALAALRSGAPRVEVAYAFLEVPEAPVATVFEAAGAPGLERELAERVSGVVAGDFPVSDRPNRDLCLGCPGRPSLCSWPPERTLAPAESL
ncbi:MAG: UvrD-helicase domain-containing protein, partial [Solirubrobacteraceae bacterium]